MKKALLPLLLLVSGAALADDAAVLKCRTLPDTVQRLACYDAMPVGASVAAQAPEQRFGIDQTVKAAKAEKPAEPEQIESSIAGDFDGWSGNATLKLANGQVWRITDNSQAVLPLMHNPKVRIKRGLMGAAYFFQVEGQNSTARVRRVE